MSTRRLVVAAAAVVALSSAGVAAAGDAPDVSAGGVPHEARVTEFLDAALDASSSSLRPRRRID